MPAGLYTPRGITGRNRSEWQVNVATRPGTPVVWWDPLGERPCPEGSTGGNRVYTRNRRRAKKFISGDRVGPNFPHRAEKEVL